VLDADDGGDKGSDDESDGGISESDDEEEDRNTGRLQKMKSKKETDEPVPPEDMLDDSELSDDPSNASGSKRKRSDDPSNAPGKKDDTTSAGARRERKKRLYRYYSSTFHGTAASKQFYELAQQLNKDRNDTLWLCILGLTDLYIHQQIGSDLYREHVEDLEDEVRRKNDDQAASYTTDDGTIVQVQESGKIHFEPVALRLMLLRHWSLYESMFHSDYTAARLGIWQARGREKLEEMLAKMGLSLKEAKQKYEFMSPQSQNLLMGKLEEHKESYGLDEIFYGSFSRSFGFSTKLSASDMVYSITALLEHAIEVPDTRSVDDLAQSTNENDENDRSGQNSGNGKDAAKVVTCFKLPALFLLQSFVQSLANSTKQKGTKDPRLEQDWEARLIL
jgi:cell division control protein 45